ncbi:MAG: PPC domain-containing DNA-binding protein [Candidatus Bathyarchaeia archaeon]
MSDAQALEGIASCRLERIVIGKLTMNTDLLDGILELIRRERIRTGLILSVVGALREATFRNVKTMPPNLKVKKKHRVYLKLDQQMELVSLTGWVATKHDGYPEVHAHFSVSTVIDDKVMTFGGHLTRGAITSIKVVVAIGVIEESDIKAVMDSRIGQVDVKLPA